MVNTVFRRYSVKGNKVLFLHYVQWGSSRQDIPESKFFKRVRSRKIDSEESIPPNHAAWRPSTLNMLVVPDRQAGNRFLCSLKV
jgi:hypothetical protein